MAEKAQRTEPPSQRRKEKARQEGNYPNAKEFVAALQFTVLVAVMCAGAAGWFAGFQQTTRTLLASAMTGEVTALWLTHAAWQIALRNLAPLAAAGMAIVIATLAFRLITTRFGLSLKKLSPDLTRLNPMARLRDLPRQSTAALIQAVVLLPVFLWAVYVIARDRLDVFAALPLAGVQAGAAVVASSVKELFWKAAAVFLIFGSVDLFRQLRKYQQDLRMSKQELRDEHKENEGNPQMKARVRRLQRDRARRQMMKEVPAATAVVVNPTHFAVAIRYQLDGMSAPLVVAKGKNYLALRIRQKAVDHGVPIVENPPLARSLYEAVDVGQEIPPHLYRAVAEILAYLFKLMNGRLPG